MRLNILIFFLLFYTTATADFKGRAFIYNKSNVYINSYVTLSQKPKITEFENPYGYSMKLKGIVGYNLGFTYMYNFNKSLGFSAGFHLAGVSFRMFRYSYKIPDIILEKYSLTPDYDCLTCKTAINHVTSFPMKFIYRVKVFQKTDLIASAGINLKLNRSYYYELNDAYPSAVDSLGFHTIQVKFENTNGKKIQLLPNVIVSLGVNQLLKNNNYINYQLTADIPTINPYTNGLFIFMPYTPYSSAGKFKLLPFSLGLEINYVFAFSRKKLRNLGEDTRRHYFNSHKDQNINRPAY